jgi:hypothetical protein
VTSLKPAEGRSADGGSTSRGTAAHTAAIFKWDRASSRVTVQVQTNSHRCLLRQCACLIRF